MNDLNQQKQQIRSLIANLTSKAHLSVTERSQLTALVQQAKELNATEERQTRAASAMASARKDVADTDEVRQARHLGAFRRYLRGDDSEIRTYAAMTTSGVAIPEDFRAAYVEKLMSFSGIRAAGANVITTTQGHSVKNPYSDDTGNIGERLNENDPTTLANPTLNKITFSAYRYGSKGVLYSSQVLHDSGIPVDAYLAKIFARRIAAIHEQEFTNGGSGAMAGVIPSITNVLTTASATVVTIGDIVGLQAIDEAYLDGARYMFSPSVERILKAMVGTDGLPVFPEMRTGRVLCGYGYTLNTSMPTALTANAKAIVFGNFHEAVCIRDVVPSLLVSRERYAELNQIFASLRHDADCQVALPDALSVLQQHA